MHKHTHSHKHCSQLLPSDLSFGDRLFPFGWSGCVLWIARPSKAKPSPASIWVNRHHNSFMVLRLPELWNQWRLCAMAMADLTISNRKKSHIREYIWKLKWYDRWNNMQFNGQFVFSLWYTIDATFHIRNQKLMTHIHFVRQNRNRNINLLIHIF